MFTYWINKNGDTLRRVFDNGFHKTAETWFMNKEWRKSILNPYDIERNEVYCTESWVKEHFPDAIKQ